MEQWVIDTNVVLDLLVFLDPRSWALNVQLRSGQACWIATPAMREELQRVLCYTNIASRLRQLQLTSESVLAQFDAWVQLRPDAPPAATQCSDPDDQKFVDLAVTHQAALFSRDKALLQLRSRLARQGVRVVSVQTLGE